MRHASQQLGVFLTVVGTMAVGSVRAEEPVAGSEASAGAAKQASISSEQVALPACLKLLDLSAKQQDQVNAIVGDYDADLAAVWKQFGDRYVATIRVEAMLLSAIEDNLTEPQRLQVREQRRRVARHEKKLAATSVKPARATAGPASAVDQELAIVGVSLTSEQELAADRIQEKYLSRLRSLNRDIQGLHARMVSLEADKFVEIEKVLTAAQLKQLSEIRQTAPAADTVPSE